MEEEGMGAAVNATAPGAFLVDLIPARKFAFYCPSAVLNRPSVKYVPEWVPGATFQRKAREWQAMLRVLRDAPFLEVKRAMVGVLVRLGNTRTNASQGEGNRITFVRLNASGRHERERASTSNR
jgi:hypothetical protein